MKNINVFVGSSTESIKVAEAIQSNLQKIVGRKGVSINVQIWHQGLCRIGDYTLTSLIEGARKFDYAILVFGPDAEIEERGERLFVPRDNVVFELGLFIGAIGRERTFIVAYDKLKLPTDLNGITIAHYSDNGHDTSIQSQLGPACQEIKDKIYDHSHSLGRSKPAHKMSLSDHYNEWWDEQNLRRDDGYVRTLVGGLDIFVSNQTFSPDPRFTYSPYIVDRSVKNVDGKKVLDLGTGSGILAISAALRGAKKVVAVDFNDSAIADAARNVEAFVRLKKIEDGVITIVKSDLFDELNKQNFGKFDVIMANLPISADAKSWEGLGDSVVNIVKRCVDGIEKHLKKKSGIAVFAWASFGPPCLIPELLHEKGFDCETYSKETFGVTWFAYIARFRRSDI